MRREPNPSDGRGTLAVITEAGREVANKATAEFNAARVRDWPALDDRATLRPRCSRRLRRLRAHADDFID